MSHLKISRKIHITFLFIIYSALCINAQISNEGVLKKYIIKDTLEEKHAELILYTNGTFLNFGLVNNKQERDWYIWFTYGNYLSVSDKLILKSANETYDMDQKMLANIKHHYIYREDYTFIKNYYEYVKEYYKDFPLMVSGNTLVDDTKEIIYIEKK